MKISVVIPTYNRYEVLKRALDSVYSQTYIPSEIIIIDDGSTDNTSQIISSVTLSLTGSLVPKIRYYYQKNSGVSSARNLGIKKANHEWIAFLDSDDEWHPEKLKQQVEFHKSNPEIFMSYTDEKWIRDAKEVRIPKKYRKFGGNIFKECLSHCIIAPSATLMHKDLLYKVGLFDESLEVCEDYDLWLRVAVENEIGLIDKKLITKYGGNEDQLSMKFWGMDRFRVKALEKFLGEIPGSSPRMTEKSSPRMTEKSSPRKTEKSSPRKTEKSSPRKTEKSSPRMTEKSSMRMTEKSSMRMTERSSPRMTEKSSLASRHSLLNPAVIPDSDRESILETLLQKYKLLLKGAIKYDRIQDINYYEKKIKRLKN